MAKLERMHKASDEISSGAAAPMSLEDAAVGPQDDGDDNSDPHSFSNYTDFINPFDDANEGLFDEEHDTEESNIGYKDLRWPTDVEMSTVMIRCILEKH